MQDLRYAVRTLRKTPYFALAAILTLALGIGASTTLFSLIYSLFYRPLPFADAAQLVHIQQTLSWRKDQPVYPLSFHDYLYYKQHNTVFSGISAHYMNAPMSLSINGDSGFATVGVVAANLFDVLRLQPALGRFFLPSEDVVPDRDAVTVISESLWDSRFARDPGVLGKTIQLNGTAFTIVGVAPRQFAGFGARIGAWIPSAMFRVGYRYCDIAEPDCRILALTARLKSGRTIAGAQAEMNVLARQLESQFPEINKGRGVAVQAALGSELGHIGQGAPAVKILGIAVGCVLWIACANVAGLLLVRGIRRKKEIVVRLALGASRGRLLRQLMTENLLLAFLGGVAGLGLAVWANDLVAGFYNMTSSGVPLNFTMEMSWPVLLSALGLSVLSAALFGALPAMQAGRLDLIGVLKDEGASVSSRSRLRNTLVIAQVAVATLLLIAAGLLLRSMNNIYAGPGYDASHIVMLRMRPTLLAYEGPRAVQFLQEAQRRIAALPGVVEASPAQYSVTPGFAGNTVTFWLPGHGPAKPEAAPEVSVNWVGPKFFRVLGVPFVAGRDFSEQDTANSTKVAIINEVLARQMWPQESAIGKTVIADGRPYRVVGVVRDAQYYSALDAPRPFFYPNFWQRDVKDQRTWDSRTHVRVTGDPGGMLARILAEVAAIDSAVPISETYAMTERMKFEFAQVRMAGAALAFFGTAGLVLSAVGLYTVLAFAVSQRTREIGIRMALGASRSNVLRLVMRQGAVLSALGLALGVGVALAAARFLNFFLYGVQQYDALAFLTAPLVLAVAAACACWLPARRATRVDPMIALRYE